MLIAILVVNHFRVQRLKQENSRALRDRSAIVNFLNRFSYAVSTMDNMNFAVVSLSRYIRDATHSESVCLYFINGKKDTLRAVASVGNFPSLKEFDGNAYNSETLPTISERDVIIGEGFLGQMAKKHKAQLFHTPQKSEELSYLPNDSRIKTMMLVPIKMDEELLGMICVVNSNDNRPFETADFNLLRSISGHATLAKNMIETYQRLEEQQRLDQELKFARDMQSSLMPDSLPSLVNNFSIYAINKSAKEVSGDYYDYIEIDEDRTLVVIADASGKGVPACIISTMTRSILRSLCNNFTSLEELLLELNGSLFKDIAASRFITMALCVIDAKRNLVECARAGHTDLLFRDEDHNIQNLKPKGAAIGLLPNMMGQHFESFSFILQPGCKLLFYTDGITEALSLDEEEYGEDRLIQLLKKSYGTNKEIVDKILVDVDHFTSSQALFDDQTIVIISCDKKEDDLIELSESSQDEEVSLAEVS